jgi:hypothetical protein
MKVLKQSSGVWRKQPRTLYAIDLGRIVNERPFGQKAGPDIAWNTGAAAIFS